MWNGRRWERILDRNWVGSNRNPPLPRLLLVNLRWHTSWHMWASTGTTIKLEVSIGWGIHVHTLCTWTCAYISYRSLCMLHGLLFPVCKCTCTFDVCTCTCLYVYICISLPLPSRYVTPSLPSSLPPAWTIVYHIQIIVCMWYMYMYTFMHVHTLSMYILYWLPRVLWKPQVES